MEGIRISDNDATVGPPRIFVEHPEAIWIPEEPVDLSGILRQLEVLQQRVEVLERRTWWSMLKEQIRGWFNGG